MSEQFLIKVKCGPRDYAMEWANIAPNLLAALKDAHNRLELIAFLGMDVPAAMCGGDHSSFYKSRAYDCIATAANGLDIVEEAIAEAAKIGDGE